MERECVIKNLILHMRKMEIWSDEICENNWKEAEKSMKGDIVIANYRICGERIMVENFSRTSRCVIGNLFNLNEITCDDSQIQNGIMELFFHYGDFVIRVSHKYFLAREIAVSYDGKVWLAEKEMCWGKIAEWVEYKMEEKHFVLSSEVRVFLKKLQQFTKAETADKKTELQKIFEEMEEVRAFYKYPDIQRWITIAGIIYGLPCEEDYLPYIKPEHDCSIAALEKTLQELKDNFHLSEEEFDKYRKELVALWILLAENNNE